MPNAIVGDLDSLRADVRAFYSALGVQPVDLAHDQDSTDLDKCIQRVQIEMEQADRTGGVHDLIVVAGACACLLWTCMQTRVCTVAIQTMLIDPGRHE